MTKEDRHRMILKLLEREDTIRVSEIIDKIDVTKMTIRRDLQELEDKNLLIRIHGGARKLENSSDLSFLELSHLDKRHIHLEEKKEIAKQIAGNIHDNETIFLGSGSTIELVYDYIDVNYAKIITNSVYVFNQFKYDPQFDLILTGGTYRSKTGSFTGIIANELLSSIYVQKAFIGINALNDTMVFNANEEEGVLQRNILNNAAEKYLVADYHKFNEMDFYQFYDLKDADYLMTNEKLPKETKEKYSKWIQIIN